MKTRWYFASFIFFLTINLQAQITEGLVAYYPFENGKAKDVTHRGGNGNIFGRMEIVNGVRGEAFYFNGRDNNIIFQGRVNRYLRGKRDFTISFYFRTDAVTRDASILSKRARCDNNDFFDIRAKDGFVKAEFRERGRYIAKNTARVSISNKQWHHYVLVRRGNTLRLFVDGLLENISRVPRIIPVDDRAYFSINGSPCRGRDGTRNLRGSIDELKVFNRALGEQEVNILFRENLPTPPRYRDSRRSPEFQIDRRKSQTSRNLEGRNGDSRMNAIFGEYSDREANSKLILNQKEFTLIIKDAKSYGWDELVYKGKYKIEAGSLYLLDGKIELSNRSPRNEKKVDFKETVIGELYQDGIDLYAFETRMKLKKE